MELLKPIPESSPVVIIFHFAREILALEYFHCCSTTTTSMSSGWHCRIIAHSKCQSWVQIGSSFIYMVDEIHLSILISFLFHSIWQISYLFPLFSFQMFPLSLLSVIGIVNPTVSDSSLLPARPRHRCRSGLPSSLLPCRQSRSVTCPLRGPQLGLAPSDSLPSTDRCATKLR